MGTLCNKLYLCICVFVFVYLVTPHSHMTNIKKMPVRTLQFFRWAALLLFKQQCHGLGPQGLTLCNKLYLCICVFVFVYLVTTHSHMTNIKKMSVRTLKFFRWAALLLFKQQCHSLGPQGLTLCNKLYLCICVFVFVYLVTPHSHKTNIKKMPERTLQFFCWAALLLFKQQCHGLGPQGLTLCNKLYFCICVFVFVFFVTPHSHMPM